MLTTKSVKPLYSAKQITKKTTPTLWVVFTSGSTPSKGTVYSSKLSRDQVRADYAKRNSVAIQSVRSRRVSNLSSRKLSNTK